MLQYAHGTQRHTASGERDRDRRGLSYDHTLRKRKWMAMMHHLFYLMIKRG